MDLWVKYHGEIGHKEPMSDPHKEIPLETTSNLMKNQRKIPQNFRKRKTHGKERLAQDLGNEIFTQS